MINIRLKISNVNNRVYKQVILRKFFNMVFFSADGKKLTIYTATVFGGMSNQNQKDEKLIPTYEKKMECTLKFQYEIKDAEASIQFSDLTESFCKQTNYIESVWGKCEKIENQKTANDKLMALYSIGLDNINMSNDPIYYISELGKTAAHEFIAICGEFKEGDTQDSSYRLRSRTESLDGIEYINWVKSEICLSQNVINKRFIFEIIFENSDSVVYYTPDFTLYFAPPQGYQVDKETAKVDVGSIKGNRNYVQSLADETTVCFREWKDKELINERKKVRVDLKEYTSSVKEHKLSEQGNITVELEIINPNHDTNKQFFVGILIAFLLAFCADKTRMNDFYSCLQRGCDCLKSEAGLCYCERFSNMFSIVFPVVMLFVYVAWNFKIKSCVPEEKQGLYKFYCCIKFIGIGAAGFLMIYTFILWMVIEPKFMRRYINCACNWYIIGALTGISLVCNVMYVIYCTKFRKKKFFDNL